MRTCDSGFFPILNHSCLIFVTVFEPKLKSMKSGHFYLTNMRILPILLIFLTTFSCTSDDVSPEDSGIVFDELALNSFKATLREQGPKLSEQLGDILIENGRNSANLGSRSQKFSEEEAAMILDPLMKESLALVKAAGFSLEELEDEFGNIDSPELIGLALYLLVLSDDDATSARYEIESDNNIVKCLMTALGLEELFNRPFDIASKASKKTLLRAVGKFAVRQLGWVGWALGVGEFVGCYYGNNSVVDMVL